MGSLPITQILLHHLDTPQGKEPEKDFLFKNLFIFPNLETVLQLLNSPDELNATPLRVTLAAKSPRPNLVKYLLSEGSAQHEARDIYSLLEILWRGKSRIEILEILLQRKIGRSKDDSEMLETFLRVRGLQRFFRIDAGDQDLDRSWRTDISCHFEVLPSIARSDLPFPFGEDRICRKWPRVS